MIDLKHIHCVSLDSSPFIYFIQENPKYLSEVEKVFSAISDGNIRGVSSYVSLVEVLVKPIQDNARDIARQYRDLMVNTPFLRLFPLDARVAEKAAELRAKYSGNGLKIRTPDAIQIATGLLNEADIFLTNDKQLKQVSEIEVIVLDENV
jgi:predicted nucleic acid-binding protein